MTDHAAGDGGDAPVTRRRQTDRAAERSLRYEHSRRGAVLVASSAQAFLDIVGRMVTEVGFRPELVVGNEPAWLSLTRTQPHVVICDCDQPVEGARLLVVEAVARSIPLVLFESGGDTLALRTLAGTSRVGVMHFPLARETFAASLDALLGAPTLRLVSPSVPEIATPERLPVPLAAEGRAPRAVLPTRELPFAAPVAIEDASAASVAAPGPSGGEDSAR